MNGSRGSLGQTSCQLTFIGFSLCGPPCWLRGRPQTKRASPAEHFAYLQQLMADGLLILAGRTLNSDYSAFGIAIFQARDDAHMRQITAEDPGVAQKLFRAEWYPYRIALHAPGNYDEG